MMDRINQVIADLQGENIQGIERYKERLVSIKDNEPKVLDLLCEARAALMFSRNGFSVTMRDAPDLFIEMDGEGAFVEVTRFRAKDKDRDDFERMQNSELFVRIDSKIEDEDGKHAWEQLTQKAKDKIRKYKEEKPYILVIVTHSNTVGGHYLETAIKDYNEETVGSDGKYLLKLNGIMMVDQWTNKNGNVYFSKTNFESAFPMSDKMTNKLSSIRNG